MPQSRKERVVNISTGDITVEDITETLTSGTAGGEYEEVTDGTYNIAAGAYRVTVINIGIMGTVTVNGDALSPNIPWEKKAQENRSTAKLDLCPAVTVVVAGGGRASYQTDTPSV